MKFCGKCPFLHFVPFFVHFGAYQIPSSCAEIYQVKCAGVSLFRVSVYSVTVALAILIYASVCLLFMFYLYLIPGTLLCTGTWYGIVRYFNFNLYYSF